MPEGFLLENYASTALVRFNRPERRNPLSISVVAELIDFLEELNKTKAAGNVIFTGTSGIFASGADLREIAAVKPKGAIEFAERGQRLMRLVSSSVFKTIAAVNGFCFGGAFDLALSCGMRIASPAAKFAHPGAGLGIITGWGGTQRLPRLIGSARAAELFFSAEPIDAVRGFEIGLVDAIAEDPAAFALEYIAKNLSAEDETFCR